MTGLFPVLVGNVHPHKHNISYNTSGVGYENYILVCFTFPSPYNLFCIAFNVYACHRLIVSPHGLITNYASITNYAEKNCFVAGSNQTLNVKNICLTYVP